jgi:protein XagA
MRKLITSIIVIFYFTNSTFAGGGWPQEKGKGYFKLGQSIIVADKFYNLNGDIIDITTISLFTTSIYGEFGITDRLTGVLYMPIFVRSTLNEVKRNQSGNIEPGDAVNSFGDTDIGIKYGITKGRSIALSVSLTLGLPLGKTAESTTDAGEPRILQTGDGEFNQMVMLEASHSFYPLPLYASIGLGFNNRTEDFSDEVRYSIEVGYEVFKNFNAVIKVYATHSLKNGNPGGGAGSGVFGNNVEYISYGPELSYNIKPHFGLTVSAAYAVGGKNVLAAPNYGFGVYYKL